MGAFPVYQDISLQEQARNFSSGFIAVFPDFAWIIP
jgi:hypothetical protein